ncbi:MAG: glycosyltransferase family protein [Planctomycetota bacterium]|jgi:glycosyltransferase involved in cell wall biosynthesis
MTKLSFIIPVRDRENQIPGLIFNIQKYYPDGEIIFAHQADKKVFNLGQLRNLGYKKSSGSIVIFMDVDVRLLSYADFEGMQEEHQHSLLMFNLSQEIKEPYIGEYIPLNGRTCTRCVSRLLCFTREQFEECGGYSNLCIGWSWEDNLLYRRAGCLRVPGMIGHVSHPYQRNDMLYVNGNRFICDTDSSRDPVLDGFRQTIAKEEPNSHMDNVYRYNFYDITVTEDFAYKALLKEEK